MVFQPILLVLTITLSSVYCTCDNKTNPELETLIFVHTIFKHCHHAPDKYDIYPNDIHINTTYAPFGYGQLTTKGKKYCFNIGQYIRQRYDGYLLDQYTKDVVWAISTNFKRTKMSLELILSGLFPPTIDDLFVENQMWQPIPYIYEDRAGLLAPAIFYCNKFIRNYCHHQHSNEVLTIITQYQQFFSELSTYTGYEINVPDDLGRIYTVLKCQEEFGLQLPAWANKYYPTILEEIYSMSFQFQSSSAILMKHNAGFLLKRILYDTDLKINNQLHQDRKIHIYSGHDYNIAALLSILGVFESHVPPFGATIYFEVHYINQQYGIKLFYHDYTTTDPQLLTIPGCEEFCVLDTLKAIVEDYLPSEYDSCEILGELDD